MARFLDALLRISRRSTYVPLCLLALSGCNVLGSIEMRAETYNATAGKYASAAILYNVVRASKAEPLSFISLEALTGHQTATIGIGLPTIIVGPGRTPAQNLFLFGPNSIGGSEATDFNIGIIDDPSSYAALLRPVDPATIAFLLEQAYDPSIIFFLFVSSLEIVDSHGSVMLVYNNDPYFDMSEKDKDAQQGCAKEVGLTLMLPRQHSKYWPALDQCFLSGFYRELYSLLNEGLYAVVDPFFVPAPGNLAKAGLCFDKVLSGISTDPKGDPSSPRNCDPILTTAAATPTSPQQETVEDWSIPNPTCPSCSKIYIRTRSVYGAYRYLGQILNLQGADFLEHLSEHDREVLDPEGLFVGTPLTNFLTIRHGTIGCWTQIHYDTDEWCVPDDAVGTKRTFQLLHQLFELYTKPSNQTVTPSARLLPQ